MVIVVVQGGSTAVRAATVRYPDTVLLVRYDLSLPVMCQPN